MNCVLCHRFHWIVSLVNPAVVRTLVEGGEVCRADFCLLPDGDRGSRTFRLYFNCAAFREAFRIHARA